MFGYFPQVHNFPTMFTFPVCLLSQFDLFFKISLHKRQYYIFKNLY